MKRYGYVVAILCIVILIRPVVEKEYDLIVGVTGYKYEYGIRIDDDDTIISGYVFKDIAIGIVVWASNTIIRDCIFIHCSDEGIVLFSTGSDNSIIDCIFIDCCDGIELQQAHNTTIKNCEFIRSYHAGIDIIGNPSYNTRVIDCIFEDNKMDIYGLQG